MSEQLKHRIEEVHSTTNEKQTKSIHDMMELERNSNLSTQKSKASSLINNINLFLNIKI